MAKGICTNERLVCMLNNNLTKEEHRELSLFKKTNSFLSCDAVKEKEHLKIWHALKEKGFIKFKGNQENLQYFQIIIKDESG